MGHMYVQCTATLLKYTYRPESVRIIGVRMKGNVTVIAKLIKRSE